MRNVRRLLVATIGLLLAGNLVILAAFGVSRLREDDPRLSIDGIENVRAVDAKLWRGNAPSVEGYRQLAERGVSTVVDLRAERDVVVASAVLDDVGIDRVHIPIRDGQTPESDEVVRFMEVVRQAEGRVFVHCGAGVGRTGVMSATYLVEEGKASPWEALGRNLAVGPPSLEQIVYAASLENDGDVEQPPGWVESVSRLFDGPRRLWSIIRS